MVFNILIIKLFAQISGKVLLNYANEKNIIQVFLIVILYNYD